MRLHQAVATLIVCSAAVAPSASAHHSPAMFDNTKQIVLSGAVRQFQWSNPHCYIQLLVEDGGQQAEWSMEMGAPIYLMNKGWSRSTLRPGDRVQVTAAPLRSGAHGGLLLSVVSLDGKTLGAVK